jgi:hypothetical protein
MERLANTIIRRRNGGGVPMSEFFMTISDINAIATKLSASEYPHLREPDLCSAALFLLQKAKGNEDRGDEEDERTQDPHDDGACALVGDWIDVERVWALEVVGVDRAVAEGEEGGECRVDDVC